MEDNDNASKRYFDVIHSLLNIILHTTLSA